MSQTGSLVVRVFTSRAQLPIEGATVVVSEPVKEGRRKVLAVKRTNESGLTSPIQLDTPDRDLSQSPGSIAPFGSYTMVVEQPDYYLAIYEQIQVFSGVETIQDVALIPLPEPAAVPSADSASPVLITPQAL